MHPGHRGFYWASCRRGLYRNRNRGPGHILHSGEEMLLTPSRTPWTTTQHRHLIMVEWVSTTCGGLAVRGPFSFLIDKNTFPSIIYSNQTHHRCQSRTTPFQEKNGHLASVKSQPNESGRSDANGSRRRSGATCTNSWFERSLQNTVVFALKRSNSSSNDIQSKDWTT